MHPVNEFLDVISVDTAFPLIRTENGPKFKSGPTRTIVSKTENEANIFLKLSHHLHFDLKDFLGSHFFLPPPATASCCALQHAVFFLSCTRSDGPASQAVGGLQGTFPPPREVELNSRAVGEKIPCHSQDVILR